MGFTDEGMLAKLSALNETQESIVTVAQWVMFHRRHADRSAALWFERLKESNPGKRVNLIYLANEVAQQSKARRKDDFLVAFSPILPEAIATAYKGANSEVQTKVRRVVEVWRQRQIFDQSVQEAVEGRIDELDKQRPAASRKPLGGSLFSESSVPSELQTLVQTQNNLSKATLSAKPLVAEASKDYEALNDHSQVQPSLQVQAHRLNSLLKTLANAEVAVAESLKTRTTLVEELERLLESNHAALREEDTQQIQLNERKAETETKKQEVEETIMRELPAEDFTDGADNRASASAQDGESSIDRPEMERFTPPPAAITADANENNDQARSTTPDGLPPSHLLNNTNSNLNLQASQPDNEIARPTYEALTPPAIPSPPPGQGAHDAAQADAFLASLEDSVHATASLNAHPPATKAQIVREHPRPESLSPGAAGAAGAGANGVASKRRKVGASDDFEGFGGGGLDELDEEVVGMLG